MNDNLTTNASNEAESPAFLVGAVISRFSQLPRKGLLADFSQIGLEQLVEFRTNDFCDLTIVEMQLEHIKARAKEFNLLFITWVAIIFQCRITT
jgi:hypothetical protein